MKATVDVLWEMEAPVRKQATGQNFPHIIGRGNVSEVPGKELEDNTDAWRAYDRVLLQEYVERRAVEVESNPETEGCLMLQCAVMKVKSATTKTGVVFNASVAAQGRASLNYVFDPGPSLLPSLVGLLLPFCESPVVVQAKTMEVLGATWTPENTLFFAASKAPKDVGAVNEWSKSFLV